MLNSIATRIAGSRRGRYWTNRIGNSPAFQPLFDIMANRLHAGLRTLAELGFAPAVIVDIGAYRGHWTRTARRYFPQARFLMVEPQLDKERDLARLRQTAPDRIEYALAVLGPEERASAPFHLAESGSSLYPDRTAFPHQTTTVPMRTLDRVAGAIEGTAFLKLDVQGAEMEVLAGGPDVLRRTDAIMLEASVLEFNIGTPLIAEVIARMDGLGFQLFDIWDLRRIGPVLAQTDLLFVRQGSELLAHGQNAIDRYGT